MNRKLMIIAIVVVFILSSSVIALANGIDSELPWMHTSTPEQKAALQALQKDNSLGWGPNIK
jgi:hypothetical protein